MIKRDIENTILEMAGYYPVVTITGPRQSGKTTLAKALFPEHSYFSLETGHVRDAALADPMAFLAQGSRGMILDEIQKAPALLEYVQSAVDENPACGRFVLTGSHQPELARAISESLAGRTGVAELLPLSVAEISSSGIDAGKRDGLLFRGGMPRIHSSRIPPVRFYADYFRTYVERDVRKLVNVSDLDRFERFVKLLAGRIGGIVNKQSLASDVGVSDKTVGNWIGVLRASYLVFELQPYGRDFGKRQVKSPKMYFTETGLAAYLLGIRSERDIASHPLVGNLFENFVVSEAVKSRLNRGLEPDISFYRNSSGTVEIDLIFEDRGRVFPVEIKSSSTFDTSMTRRFRPFSDLCPEAEKGLVVYSGETIPGIAANFADVAEWCV
ncbi:MAG: ATP-binding protein [Kiritimatiellae bacterium]|nr:ATP-binding protein [Kiritimatiellia bacterium]